MTSVAGTTEMLVVAAAAFAAGLVNALAGGGTLITFPALIAVGLSPVAANVTNTVALCPGYLGGAFAQRHDLNGQRGRLWVLLPLGAAGGIAGAWALLATGERVFRSLVPFLILGASLLLAAQEPLKRWMATRITSRATARVATADHRHGVGWFAAILLALGAVYGGYFGAGLGILTLAVLAATVDDSLTRLNALKQVLSLVINVAAALFFVATGGVDWTAAAIMAIAALAGGSLGGRLAGRISPVVLRAVVVCVGVVVGVVYLVR